MKDIAGKWTGTLYRRDGRNVAATLTIKEDGTWEHLIPALTNPGPLFVGSMTVVDGKYRFTSATTGNTGTATLHEGDGKRILILTNDTTGGRAEYRPAQ
jgi:hypothetical protein